MEPLPWEKDYYLAFSLPRHDDGIDIASSYFSSLFFFVFRLILLFPLVVLLLFLARNSLALMCLQLLRRFLSVLHQYFNASCFWLFLEKATISMRVCYLRPRKLSHLNPEVTTFLQKAVKLL